MKTIDEKRDFPELDADLLNRIIDLCSSESAVVAAYLFGSAASGRRRAKSDIDLAILVEEDAADTFPLLSFVTSMGKLCGCRVDVVILNRAGEILKHQVRKSGRLLFEREPRKRKTYEISGRKAYEDFLHLHRKHVRTVLYGGRNG
jgi:predicted nucleotidyltransferase